MQTYAPGTRVEQYEIDSPPLTGSMGQVYYCLDHGNDDRPVALKTFMPELLPDRKARDSFLREGTAWIDMGRHTHIVRCYEVKYVDPIAFLILELIARENGMEDASLNHWMRTSMSMAQALMFALQIARGMKHATKKIPGLVHRDLKPANVLVGADKLPGTNINRLRVTDFGLASIQQGETNIGDDYHSLSELGAPAYKAPEQWTDKPVGAYTDVYALGCILYELLTRQRAARGLSSDALQAAHCSGNLRPVPDNLPESVHAFLKRSLAMATEERYQMWDEVTTDLEEICAGLGEEPVPPEQGQEDESDEERRSMAWSYNEMGTSYALMGKAQVALERYFEKALDIFLELKDKGGEAAALGKLGNAHDHLGRPQAALDHLEKALQIYRTLGDRHREVATLNDIGEMYRKTGELPRAISFCKQNLAIARDYGDRRAEGNAQCSLGLVYASLGELHRAISYFEQYLEIAREIGYRRAEGVALGALGSAYAQLKETQRAIDYLKQYETIARKIGDRVGEGNALSSLGNSYFNLGDMDQAIDYYEQGLEIAQETGDRRVEEVVLGNLGNAYAQKGEWQNAIDFYEQRLEIVREVRDPTREGIVLSNLGNAYAMLGDIPKALNYAQKSVGVFKQVGHIPYAQRAQQLVDQLRSGNPFR